MAYFRYVDDIVLVGERGQVDGCAATLQDRLGALGFKLYDDQSPKTMSVPASSWLDGRDDFSERPGRSSWPSFVGSLKLYLLRFPDGREALRSAFGSEGFRVPVRDYSSAVLERGALEGVRRLSRRWWYRARARATSQGGLVGFAVQLRRRYQAEFEGLREGLAGLSGYERKRRIPKLRYRAGILTYLADDASLLELASSVESVPELRLQSQVMKAVSTGEVDGVLALGTNAAQAAAQPLLAAGKACSASAEMDSDVKRQGLATFLFNGVSVSLASGAGLERSGLLRFASRGADMTLMRSRERYLRELACLHGLRGTPRHSAMLASAFDEDEALAMDAVEQLQGSASP